MFAPVNIGTYHLCRPHVREAKPMGYRTVIDRVTGPKPFETIRCGPLGLGLLLIWLCLPARAADKNWTEVRSPHFRVLTDGSDQDARRVAREFEQMRGAMSEVFPGVRLDSGVPLLVLVPRDESSMKYLAPGFWKQKGA